MASRLARRRRKKRWRRRRRRKRKKRDGERGSHPLLAEGEGEGFNNRTQMCKLSFAQESEKAFHLWRLADFHARLFFSEVF